MPQALDALVEDSGAKLQVLIIYPFHHGNIGILSMNHYEKLSKTNTESCMDPSKSLEAI